MTVLMQCPLHKENIWVYLLSCVLWIMDRDCWVALPLGYSLCPTPIWVGEPMIFPLL